MRDGQGEIDPAKPKMLSGQMVCFGQKSHFFFLFCLFNNSWAMPVHRYFRNGENEQRNEVCLKRYLLISRVVIRIQYHCNLHFHLSAVSKTFPPTRPSSATLQVDHHIFKIIPTPPSPV